MTALGEGRFGYDKEDIENEAVALAFSFLVGQLF